MEITPEEYEHLKSRSNRFQEMLQREDDRRQQEKKEEFQADLQESIPAAVKRYATSWRGGLLERQVVDHLSGKRAEASPLEQYVHSYLERTFKGLLDNFLGIESRSFGEIRTKEGDVHSVVHKLRAEIVPMLEAQLRDQFQTIHITTDDKDKLRVAFKKAFLYALEQKLMNLAKTRAEAMAEDILNACMTDDEWVAITESKLSPAKKPNGG